MATFQVLKGGALGKAITGQGKAIATFTAREHQLAYSSLAHMEASDGKEASNDVKYLNALLAVTPSNYRKGLVSWACAFGRVSYEVETREFAYAKAKKADLAAAMEIAPANYEKASKSDETKKPFDEITYIERALKKLTDEGASHRVIKAMEGVLNVAKTSHLTIVKTDKAPKAEKVEKTEQAA